MNEQTNRKSPEPGIVIFNRSTLVSDEVVRRIAEACAYQVREHVEPAYGLLPVDVWFSPDMKAPEGSQVVIVFDDDEQVRKLGFYDDDPENADPRIVGIRVRRPDGVSYARAFAKPWVHEDGTLNAFEGAQSLSCSISHEVVEARVDRLLNRWVMGPGGRVYALEVADPVEEQAYPVADGDGDVSVANFVLPAWFDGLAERGPFDQMQKLGLQPDGTAIQKPFTCSDGGYIAALFPPADPTREDAAKLGPEPPDGFTERRPASKRSPLSRNSWRSLADAVIWSGGGTTLGPGAVIWGGGT